MQQPAWYIDHNGLLDTKKLFHAFTQFYRENIAAWLSTADSPEIVPHLIFMAFLQRVINGGGSINREYALGRRRVDLLICYPFLQPKQRIVIEIKILRNQKTLPEGLQQTADYMQTSNATEGHLVIFDRSDTKSWDERIYDRVEMVDGKKVWVWGM